MGRVHDPRMTSRANRPGFLASATTSFSSQPSGYLETLYNLPTPPNTHPLRNFRVARQISTSPHAHIPSPQSISRQIHEKICDTEIASTYTYSVGNSYPFPSNQSSLITQLPRRGPPHCGDGDVQLGPDKRFGASITPGT